MLSHPAVPGSSVNLLASSSNKRILCQVVTPCCSGFFCKLEKTKRRRNFCSGVVTPYSVGFFCKLTDGFPSVHGRQDRVVTPYSVGFFCKLYRAIGYGMRWQRRLSHPTLSGSSANSKCAEATRHQLISGCHTLLCRVLLQTISLVWL